MTALSQPNITALAEQVVAHLDGEWSVEPFPSDWGRKGAWLREDGGAILTIGESLEYADRNKNRLVVGTDYPRETLAATSTGRRPPPPEHACHEKVRGS